MWTIVSAIGLGLWGPLAPGAGDSAPGERTYFRDIEPVFRAKCVSCHRSGGVGPFALDSYPAVSKRLELIRTVVLSHIMPPFDVRSDYGGFQLPAPLSDEESLVLQEWIRNGAPRGDEVAMPPTKGNARGPATVSLPVTGLPKVRVEGVPYWMGFLIPTESLSGKAIRGFDVSPRSPMPLRNAVLAIVPKTVAKKLRNGAEVAGGEVDGRHLVGAWTPGGKRFQLPSGLGFAIRPGDMLYIRVHLAPVGRPLSGDFTLNLDLAPTKDTQQPTWLSLGRQEFVIAANEAPVLSEKTRLATSVRVLSVLPEARYYASKVVIRFKQDGAKAKSLFETLRWNPQWIANFQFDRPLLLPSGGTLEASISYNNDERCVMNEGRPPQPVYSGLGRTNELFWAHILIAPARG